MVSLRSSRRPIDRRSLLGLLSGTVVGSLAGCLGDDDPAISVPESKQVDRPAEIGVADLSPSEQVTIVAEAEEPRTGQPWTAEATFEADDDGRVDVAEQSPVEGDYDGVDPMGLFWAKEPESGSTSARFGRESYEVDLSVWRPDEDEPVATASTERRQPDVETDTFDGDVFGSIHLPPGGAQGPGVLLLHGSGGYPMESRASVFAGRGFVAAALQYFGSRDGLSNGLVEVPLEYVERALDRLRAHDRVTGDEVGVYGVSKGGELALLAAAHLDGIGATASVVGSGLALEGLTANWNGAGTSSWSIGGDPVPYVPFTDLRDAETARDYYEAALEAADEGTVAAAELPIERADRPIVAVSGGDDQVWQSVELTRQAFDRLDGDHVHEHRVYEDAGHAIDYPYRPTYGSSEGRSLTMGGTPEAYATANPDHWTRVLELFEDELPG